MDFIRLTIQSSHPWVGQPIKELTLPPDCLLVMIIRDKKTLVPQGDTVIRAGDMIAVSYTHLVVYKRQRHGYAVAILGQGHRGAGSRSGWRADDYLVGAGGVQSAAIWH